MNFPVDEVCVFYAAKINKWIIREFHDCGRLGDSTVDKEPSDEELHDAYGQDVNIRREYDIISTKATRMIVDKINESNAWGTVLNVLLNEGKDNDQ